MLGRAMRPATWIRGCAPALAALLCAPAHAADRDACSLLTAAEVSKVVGAPFRDGVHVGSTSATVCGWSISDPPRTDEPKVVVAVKTPEAFERGKTPVGGKVVKAPVSGLGDEAYSVVIGTHDATLVVRKGSNAFDVTLRGSGKPVEQVLEKEKQLAQRVLARL
jgi:hypothetical protein